MKIKFKNPESKQINEPLDFWPCGVKGAILIGLNTLKMFVRRAVIGRRVSVDCWATKGGKFVLEAKQILVKLVLRHLSSAGEVTHGEPSGIRRMATRDTKHQRAHIFSFMPNSEEAGLV